MAPNRRSEAEAAGAGGSVVVVSISGAVLSVGVSVPSGASLTVTVSLPQPVAIKNRTAAIAVSLPIIASDTQCSAENRAPHGRTRSIETLPETTFGFGDPC